LTVLPSLKIKMLNRVELNKLYQYAFSLTAESSSAEDLLQTALEKCIKQPAHKQSSAYVRKIIRNQYIDDCRRNKVVSFEMLDETAPMMLDDSSLEKQVIDAQLVELVFDQLKAAEREVLFLWAVVGYSTSEIAKELQQSRGTVLSRLYRARQKILDKMPGEIKPFGAGESL
jgi:RNA polymerase sigma-70 factor, ECF subfamily